MNDIQRCTFRLLQSLLTLTVVLSLLACTPQNDFVEPMLDNLSYFNQVQVEKLDINLKKSDYTTSLIWQHGGFSLDEGVFRYSEEREVLEFSDWTTNEVYPLCTKANCMHKDEKCNAFFSVIYDTPRAVYYNGTHVFYECSKDSATTEFYRQNIDGSDRQRVFVVDETFNSNWVLYHENMVYFTTVSLLSEDDSEDTNNISNYCNHIYEGNLQTGEVRVLPCEFSGQMVDIELWGLYDEQLVILYRRTVSDNGFFLSPQSNIDTDNTILLFDLQTNEMTGVVSNLSNENTAFAVGGISCGVLPYAEIDLDTKNLVKDWPYYSGRIVVADLSLGNLVVLPQVNGLDWTFDVLDQKIFYHAIDADSNSAYVVAQDIGTGEVMYIPEETSDLIILGETKSWFYGDIEISDGQYAAYRIRKTDYFEGKRNLVFEGMVLSQGS